MASRSRTPRRRWSVAFKKRVAVEAGQPGACAAQIARRYDLDTNLLSNWKKKYGTGAGLVPVEIVADDDGGLPRLRPQRPDERSAPSVGQQASAVVEIDLPCGARVRCGSDVSLVLLAQIITALRSKR